jgi:hypothetical protein
MNFIADNSVKNCDILQQLANSHCIIFCPPPQKGTGSRDRIEIFFINIGKSTPKQQPFLGFKFFRWASEGLFKQPFVKMKTHLRISLNWKFLWVF